MQLLGQLAADRPVDRDHAAVGRDRVAGQRLQVGLQRVGADRHPAGVVVLDDHAGRLLEVADQAAGRVEVEDVVEGERPPVQLRAAREDVAAQPRLGVERRPLVRVLAVGEVEHLLVSDRQVFREVLVLHREPAADRGVVARGLGEGLVGEPVAGGGGDLAAALFQLGADRVVGLRFDDHGDALVVLRRGADHRRPADVDVLDRHVVRDFVAGDGLLEGVEVDADDVDRLDPLALQRRHVLGVAAPRQQRRVQPRVQRLHPAAEDLFLAGELGDVGDLEPRLAQRRRGAAGGEDLDPERRQPLGEVGDAGLVGDRDQRPPHPDLAVAEALLLGFGGGLSHRSRPCAGRWGRS